MIRYAGECTAALAVTNLERAVAFYRDALGFEVAATMGDYGWAQLRSPVAGLEVGLSTVEEVQQGGGATLTFEVTDLDVARAELERAGVRFDGETFAVGERLRIATLYDPDGNQLMLTEHRSG